MFDQQSFFSVYLMFTTMLNKRESTIEPQAYYLANSILRRFLEEVTSARPAANVQQIISAQNIVLFLALPNVQQIVRYSTRPSHPWCTLFRRRPWCSGDPGWGWC